jgi:hypothetical protein
MVWQRAHISTVNRPSIGRQCLHATTSWSRLQLGRRAEFPRGHVPFGDSEQGGSAGPVSASSGYLWCLGCWRGP